MKGVDWQGLINEIVARSEHIRSATAAVRWLKIRIDRQVLERWRKNVKNRVSHGMPRSENIDLILDWARRTLTAEELVRYRVPLGTADQQSDESDEAPRRNERLGQPRIRRR